MLAFHDEFDHRWFASHPWALIDASWRDELPTHWRARVIAPAFLGEDTARCPVLLDLRQLTASERGELMDRLAAQVRDREDILVSLLLASQAQTSRLLAHLADRLVLRPPGADGPRQFRFFDPGTFLQLPRALGADGMAWLFGPVESALAPWAGQWTQADRPTVLAPLLRLREVHLQALSRIGAVNRAALQMAAPASAADWIHRCDRIDGHVLRAWNHHGLTQVDDLAAFAGHAIRYHGAFDTHPLLTTLLAQLRAARPEDELDYRELSARLGAEDWLRLVRELPPQQESPTP